MHQVTLPLVKNARQSSSAFPTIPTTKCHQNTLQTQSKLHQLSKLRGYDVSVRLAKMERQLLVLIGFSKRQIPYMYINPVVCFKCLKDRGQESLVQAAAILGVLKCKELIWLKCRSISILCMIVNITPSELPCSLTTWGWFFTSFPLLCVASHMLQTLFNQLVSFPGRIS